MKQSLNEALEEKFKFKNMTKEEFDALVKTLEEAGEAPIYFSEKSKQN